MNSLKPNISSSATLNSDSKEGDIGSPTKSLTVTPVLELGKEDKPTGPEKALSDAVMSQKENKEPPFG